MILNCFCKCRDWWSKCHSNLFSPFPVLNAHSECKSKEKEDEKCLQHSCCMKINYFKKFHVMLQKMKLGFFPQLAYCDLH